MGSWLLFIPVRSPQRLGIPCIEISTLLPRQRLWRPAGMVGRAGEAENHTRFPQDSPADAMPRSELQAPAGQPRDLATWGGLCSEKIYDNGRYGDCSSVPYVAAASPGQMVACGGHTEPGSTYICVFQRSRTRYSQNEPDTEQGLVWFG